MGVGASCFSSSNVAELDRTNSLPQLLGNQEPGPTAGFLSEKASGHMAKAGGSTEHAYMVAPSCAGPYTGSPYKDFENTKFADLLLKERLAVVKMEYFEECLKNGVSFQDRASIPDRFFYTGEEVLKLWKRYGHGFLVVISYAWLSKESPDPDLYHLRRLVPILRAHKAWHMSGRCVRMRTKGQVGVILDYCSLWQARPDAAGRSTRTPEQEHHFKDGLSEINTPYGHEEITAIKLRSVPPTELRKYEIRGWTLFESTIIDSKGNAPSGQRVGHWNCLTADDDFDPDTTEDSQSLMRKLATASRKPPLPPDAFGEEMRYRGELAKAKNVPLFTNGKEDLPFTINKYGHAFQQLVHAETLQYRGSQTVWTNDEIHQFIQVLPHFTMMKKLVFEFYDCMSEENTKAFVEKLVEKLEAPDCRVETLKIGKNPLGDASAKAFAEVLSKNSSLKALWVQNANFSDEGKQALEDEWYYSGRPKKALHL